MSSEEPTLEEALRGARALDTDAHAVHAGERLAWAMSHDLAPAISLSRTPLAPMWLEPWAACQPLTQSGPARLVRTATVVRTARDLVCIDPCLADAWARTPLGERMRSLHPRDTSETFPMTLTEALGPPGHFTEVIFTSLAFQSLRELLGATHGDGLEHALAPYFQGARVIVGPGALTRARTELDRNTDVRDAFARLRVDHVTEVTGPTLLPSGLVAIPTGGYVPEHLAVAFVQKIDRPRVAVVTSQLTSREQLSPYESTLPGLREHARLRDTELAPRGDAADRAAHLHALRFERALADRDPADPRFHLVYPSQTLR